MAVLKDTTGLFLHMDKLGLERLLQLQAVLKDMQIEVSFQERSATFLVKLQKILLISIASMSAI